VADIVQFPKLSAEAAAAHLFVGITRLRQLQREGVLPRANSAGWDLDTLRHRYIEHLRAVKGNHLPKTVRRPQGDDGGDEPDLNVERAKLAREQREGHALKNAVSRGELIPAADVVEGWQSAIARSRSLLLGIPMSAAEELVVLAAQGPAAVRERLADLVHGALEELADTSPEDAEDSAA
jgi:phage terminase Nu1 subunit (DNA packaging protein)